MVRSVSICGVSSSIASTHGPSPASAFHVVDPLRDAVAGADGDVAAVSAHQQTRVIAPGDDQRRGDADGRVDLARLRALVDDLGQRGEDRGRVCCRWSLAGSDVCLVRHVVHHFKPLALLAHRIDVSVDGLRPIADGRSASRCRKDDGGRLCHRLGMADDSSGCRAEDRAVIRRRVEARRSRQTDDHRRASSRKAVESCCFGRTFARCDLLDRLRARADHGRVAAGRGDGGVCVAAAADRGDPADPGAGRRVLPPSRDDLHPGRRVLHRGPGELRTTGGANRGGGAADRLRGHRRDPVRGGHGGGGLRDAGAGPLQPGDHRRLGADLLLRQPAWAARGRPDVRGADVLVHRHAHADGRGRRRA